MATILLVTNGYMPYRYTGADIYHHQLAKLFQRHGHTVEVSTNYIREPYEYDGVMVHGPRHRMVEHDICVGIGSSLVAYKGTKRTCCIVHNCVRELHMRSHYGVMYVAEHLRQRFNYKCSSDFIWHPMCRLEPAKQPRKKIGKTVGMVNIDARKGGADLGGIAKALPEYKFIAYESWGEPVKFDLPNIEYRPFNENIQDFYNEIDILLIPSKSEGYCTVALEALSQGVPVVGSDIPGIREVVGDAGILGDCYACNIRKVTVEHSAKSLQRFADIQQDETALLAWFGL